MTDSSAAAGAESRVADMLYGNVHKKRLFWDRGLSDRLVEALVQGGIDAPEHLLFMTDAEIRAIRGIGKAAAAEIEKYRSRSIPGGSR